jgi:aminopeptidase N
MKKTGFLVVGLLAVAVVLPAQRLPQNVTPESYRLKFTPDLAKATFSGEETIRVKLAEAANSITLNAAEIQFQKVMLSSGGKVQIATVTSDEKKDQVTFTVPAGIPAGPAQIHVQYTGILNDQLRGFYLSQTKRRRYAVTQFEATDARRAFPSFDEPAFKATYDITLVIDKDDTAISNGSIISDTAGPAEGKHTLVFSTTPKMSTYLVAFMVGDFQCVSGSADEIPVRVCSVPEKKPLINYALTAAENILKFYDHYYTIKYPFKKLDIIAFPDFAAGAMENTAAITYRETALLLDDKTGSLDQRKTIVDVLAHEMAHQWFGDLVTMKWWNDIWLNEGFATWMSNKPTESFKPEWNASMDEIQGTGGSLGGDQIAGIRAIRQDANTPEEIGALFDGIAYGKSAAVLRMIENYVGSEPFRAGVNLYLGKHAYSNATAEDFWNAETEATHKPIDQIMATFVNQSAAPLVTLKSACRAGHTDVTLSQQRYFADRAKMDAGSPELWQIPVCLKTQGAAGAHCVVLKQKEETFQLDGCSPWVFGNATGRGYYRVGYDGAALKVLTGVAETALTPEERISFLNDSWAMVRIGRQSIGDYLNTVAGLSADRTRAVMESMLNHFQQIHDQVVSAEDRPAFEAWTRQLLHPIAEDLGMKAVAGESDERNSMRSTVLAVLGYVGNDPEVIAAARATTESYMKDPASVDPEVVGPALGLTAFNGDAALYDQFREHMKTAKTPEEYFQYFGNLGSFKDPELAKRTADLFLTPDVKGQDMFQMFGILGNEYTQQVAWDFFKAHFKEIKDKLGPGLGGGMVNIANVFCDEKLRDDSQKFFADQKLPGSERDLANARERVNACIELRQLQQPNLAAFLKQEGGSAAAGSKN